MTFKHHLMVTSTLLAATFGASAHAQQANTIEELVVTAERREQSLQDVPVAISAFTSEARDLVGITTVQDMSNFTPGLQYSSQLDRISLRGVGRLTNVQAADPGVATYSDGIYTSSTVEAGKTPIFTDRVEILRGPQGTLYGRNSIGGAINVISKRPTEDFYAEVRGTYANYNRTIIEGAISGPLAEGLRVRLAANYDKQRKGYSDNLVPGLPSEGNVIDTIYAEAQVEADLGERVDFWTKIAVSRWDHGGGGPGARTTWTRGDYSTLAEDDTLTFNAGYAYSGFVTNVNAYGITRNPSQDDPRKFALDTPQRIDLDNTIIIAAHLTYHADTWDLRYIGGGSNYRYTLTSDQDGTAVQSFTIPVSPVFISAAATPCRVVPSCTPLIVFPRYISVYREEKHWISHEVNFASTHDGPFQWLVGAYNYHESTRQPVYTILPDQPQVASPIPAIPGTPSPTNPERRIYDNRPKITADSYAVFGQVDWEFAPTFKLTVGLRYSHDEKYGYERARVICFGPAACLGGARPEGLGSLTPAVDVTRAVVFTGPAPEGVSSPVTFDALGFARRDYRAEWEAVTGTAGLQWEPDESTMVYGRYSRGYKAGGFRVGIDTTLGAFPYTDAEHADAFEVGFKKNWSRFQANAAAFYYDYRDLQAPLTVANTSGALAVSESRFVNVPKARNYGVELETVWQATDNLRILFNYSYVNAKIRELTGVVDPNDPTALNQSATPLTPLTPCAVGTPLCDVNTGQRQRAQDLKGNWLPQTAPHKVAVNALYTWDLSAGSVTASASYIWRDRQYGSLFTRGYNKAPAWDQVDARVSFKDADDRYTVIGYVKNVFDQIGYEGGATATRRAFNRAGALPVSVADVRGVEGLVSSYPITPPRTYGVEVQYRF